MKLRIGHGFDLHRMQTGEGMKLGGVWIPCAWRLEAHSDGDVILHALCDALLGALALGDLGRYFPDHNPEHHHQDSRYFVAQVMAMVQERGYVLNNADVTVLAQAPRLEEHKEAMRHSVAQCCLVASDAISIKATTMEGLDAIGQQQALAAHVVVLLQQHEEATHENFDLK